jgi:hypothetical protein
MGFQAPLSTFLSYSHDDDPELFREFQKQLKPLVQDEVIGLWSDRDIAAGMDWNQEINQKVNECQLFLALTSPSFNDSPYIEGVEMKTAMQRHSAGECRIIPIMWRQWRPPRNISALQFLTPPGMKAVASADKRDDVLCQVVVQIEGEVKRMTQGQWTPQRILEPLPQELPYLCDWMKPVNRLSMLRPPEGAARRPGVLILIATLDDCADRFLDRIHRTTLPPALDIEGQPVHDFRLMDWPGDPDSVPNYVHLALEAQQSWKIEQKLREGLTIVKTATDDWDTADEAVLKRVLSEWSGDSWILPATRRMLLVVTVLTTARDEGLQARIEGLIAEQPGGCAAVITLPEIEQADAINWTSLPEVRGRCRSDKVDDLTADIAEIYKVAGAKVRPMKPLASGLMKLLEAYRKDKAA